MYKQSSVSIGLITNHLEEALKVISNEMRLGEVEGIDLIRQLRSNAVSLPNIVVYRNKNKNVLDSELTFDEPNGKHYSDKIIFHGVLAETEGIYDTSTLNANKHFVYQENLLTKLNNIKDKLSTLKTDEERVRFLSSIENIKWGILLQTDKINFTDTEEIVFHIADNDKSLPISVDKVLVIDDTRSGVLIHKKIAKSATVISLRPTYCFGLLGERISLMKGNPLTEYKMNNGLFNRPMVYLLKYNRELKLSTLHKNDHKQIMKSLLSTSYTDFKEPIPTTDKSLDYLEEVLKGLEVGGVIYSSSNIRAERKLTKHLTFHGQMGRTERDNENRLESVFIESYELGTYKSIENLFNKIIDKAKSNGHFTESIYLEDYLFYSVNYYKVYINNGLATDPQPRTMSNFYSNLLVPAFINSNRARYGLTRFELPGRPTKKVESTKILSMMGVHSYSWRNIQNIELDENRVIHAGELGKVIGRLNFKNLNRDTRISSKLLVQAYVINSVIQSIVLSKKTINKKK